jgi:hypothetical protein
LSEAEKDADFTTAVLTDATWGDEEDEDDDEDLD